MRLPVILVACVALSCGTPTRANCTAANCNGCCDGNSECVAGISAGNCGRGGQLCESCGASQSCVSGTCQGGNATGGGSGGGTSGTGGGTSGTGGGTSGTGGGSSGTGGGSSGTGGGSVVADGGCGTVAANHLLINEVSVQPTGGEFVEIFNPTGAAIDLSNIYLYNATFDPLDGGTQCRYPFITTGGDCGDDFSDFSLRFPAGAMIGAGAVQVIAVNGADGYCAFYACDGGVVQPTYEVVVNQPQGDTAGVANMRGKVDFDGGVGGLLSNTSEELVLFQWNGSTSTVKDIDYVIWGTTLAYRTDKTTYSGYSPDTAIANQKPLSGALTNTTSWQRWCTAEGQETKSGGNGATGHNETSEPLDVTFREANKTPGAKTSGETP